MDSTGWIDSKLIELYGQDITIYTKSVTKDENNNVISEGYSNTIQTRGWVIPFSSLREQYGYYGYRVEGDYSVCVDTTIPTNINDKVVFVDNTSTEIREVLSHFEGNTVAYKELIVRKEE
jgi:hypothetical protein